MIKKYEGFASVLKSVKRGKQPTPATLQKQAQTAIEFLGDCPRYDAVIGDMSVDRAKTCLLAAGHSTGNASKIVADWLELINPKNDYDVLIARLRRTK